LSIGKLKIFEIFLNSNSSLLQKYNFLLFLLDILWYVPYNIFIIAVLPVRSRFLASGLKDGSFIERVQNEKFKDELTRK
jgi:hypothetical protein